MDEVDEHPQLCPLCGGTRKGNKTYGYLCPRCMVLFEVRDISSTMKR